jgi:hypothetical protein
LIFSFQLKEKISLTCASLGIKTSSANEDVGFCAVALCASSLADDAASNAKHSLCSVGALRGSFFILMIAIFC